MISLLCDHVIVIPDVIKIIVFNNGILKGSKIWILVGGQVIPKSKVGDKLEWKNLQKNEIKNNSSELIKRIIPHFIPIITWLVWNPWKVLSRITSRHQVYMVNKIINIPSNISIIFFKCNHLIEPVNITAIPIDAVIGHGL